MPDPVPAIPPPDKIGIIDVSDVRAFIYDRTALDNPLDLDLSWSDAEIGNAMRFAAMRYNDIPPYVEFVDPAKLPFGSAFLAGISYYLYIGQMQKLQRNDLDYSAGNVEVEINKRRIEHFKELAGMFAKEFEQRAKERKWTINLSGYYASF